MDETKTTVTEKEVSDLAAQFGDIFRAKLHEKSWRYGYRDFEAAPFQVLDEFLSFYMARHANEGEKLDAARAVRRANLVEDKKSLKELLEDADYREDLERALSMLRNLPRDMEIEGKEAFRRVLIERFGLKQYAYIMDRVRTTDVSQDEDFQCAFYSFYHVRGIKKEVFFRVFQELKEDGCTDFDTALEEMKKATGRVEPVFTSKILATIDKNLPILDSHVMKVLGIDLPEGILEAKAAYIELRKWYEHYMNSDEAEQNIDLWKETFRDYPRYAGISDVKIIDFLLWGLAL